MEVRNESCSDIVNEKQQKSIRRARLFSLGTMHLVLFYLCYWAGFILRFDYSIPDADLAILWGTLPLVLGVKMLVFYFTGNFHGRIRYITFFDLVLLLKATVISFLLLTAIDEYLLRETQTVVSQSQAPILSLIRFPCHDLGMEKRRRYHRRFSAPTVFPTPDNDDSTGNGTRISP
jgi:FlaA1/EpsC-like NDP-sugar epimerase